MAWVLHFETKTDVSARYTLIDATGPGPNVNLQTDVPAGADWTSHEVAVNYVGAISPELHLSIAKSSGGGTLFIRRVWLADSGAPLDPLNYGGWPQGNRYSSLEQDGPGDEGWMAFDTAAPPALTGAFQYSIAAGGFVNSDTSCDWYFLPPIPNGWKVGALGPAR